MQLFSGIVNEIIAGCVMYSITGCGLALHCCKAHSKMNRKMENSTPRKIVTPKNFILKLRTRDYVQNVTY